MIIHFTTVHSRLDTRIRYKETDALSKAFPDRVMLYVQDGLGNETDKKNGLKIYDTGTPFKGRVRRMVYGSWRMYKALRKASPEIAHFHDPELIPVGLLLKLSGIKVIYDVHENVSKQILAKSYIGPVIVRIILSKFFFFFEKAVAYFFDLMVGATESVVKKFPSEKSITIKNFPRADLIRNTLALPREDEKFSIIYAGSLSEKRGILDLVVAMEFLPDRFSLHLLGKWSDADIERKCLKQPGWKKCHYFGRVPHSEVPAYIKRCDLGVQLTHDIPNHRGGLPTKVFEYMFMHVPCLISDTDEKRAFFGDLVYYAKSENIQEIAKTIIHIELKYNERIAKAKSANTYATDNYSWQSEAKALVIAYRDLIEEKH